MAKIVPSKEAPDVEVTYALGGAKPFKLSTGGSQETDDPALIGDARVHPWLEVEYDPKDSIEPYFRQGSVPYEKDALSGVNSLANDKDAVLKARAELEDVDAGRVAIEAGKDQDKAVSTGGVAETLAADKAQVEELTSDTPKGNGK